MFALKVNTYCLC